MKPQKSLQLSLCSWWQRKPLPRAKRWPLGIFPPSLWDCLHPASFSTSYSPPTSPQTFRSSPTDSCSKTQTSHSLTPLQQGLLSKAIYPLCLKCKLFQRIGCFSLIIRLIFAERAATHKQFECGLRPSIVAFQRSHLGRWLRLNSGLR